MAEPKPVSIATPLYVVLPSSDPTHDEILQRLIDIQGALQRIEAVLGTPKPEPPGPPLASDSMTVKGSQ
jgi:hypothetical protein